MMSEVGKQYKVTHTFSFIDLFINLPNTMNLLVVNWLFVDNTISFIYYTKALLRTYCFPDTVQGKEDITGNKLDEDSYLLENTFW